MIINLYTVIFATFLNACNGVGWLGGKNIDIDNIKYSGDPIKFACISKPSQNHFDITVVNGSIPENLVNRLKNGNDLSLYFHGADNEFDSKFDSFFQYAKKWYEKSQNNICAIFYAYNSTKVMKISSLVNKMVRDQRLEYVAKMARDLVLDSNANLSRVNITGFSFGAHIAGRTCQYLNKKGKRKVRKLLALDPIKIPTTKFGPKVKDSIRKDVADNVQVVHTSKDFGIMDHMGDVDIYVIYKKPKKSSIDAHGIAFFIHLGTCTKQIYVWARKKSKGQRPLGTVLDCDGTTYDDESPVGVYSDHQTHHRGKNLTLYLTDDRLHFFWKGIGKFDLPELRLGSYDYENELVISEVDECHICFDNMVNIELGCNCPEPRVCLECWDKWKKEKNFDNLCPLCRNPATQIKKYTRPVKPVQPLETPQTMASKGK